MPFSLHPPPAPLLVALAALRTHRRSLSQVTREFITRLATPLIVYVRVTITTVRFLLLRSLLSLSPPLSLLFFFFFFNFYLRLFSTRHSIDKLLFLLLLILFLVLLLLLREDVHVIRVTIKHRFAG